MSVAVNYTQSAKPGVSTLQNRGFSRVNQQRPIISSGPPAAQNVHRAAAPLICTGGAAGDMSARSRLSSSNTALAH